ncbi:MAG: flagellar protein FlbB [Spirochaetota bacterium]
MTERTRIFYLILLIIFLLVIGFFLFDYYRFIEADEIFPALAKKPAEVKLDQESPTEVEKLEFQKQAEKLLEEREELERMKKELEAEKEKLQSEREKLKQAKENLDKKSQNIALETEESKSRQERVKAMAKKVSGMPPQKAVEMLVNWPDTDIIDVFKQMDKTAEEEGTSTITTYLLTLFSPERRAVITSKWLDDESSKPPVLIPGSFDRDIVEE